MKFHLINPHLKLGFLCDADPRDHSTVGTTTIQQVECGKCRRAWRFLSPLEQNKMREGLHEWKLGLSDAG